MKNVTKQTAMQELMNWTFHFQDEMISANEVIIKAHKLLEKEKEQIIQAVNYGNKQDFYDATETELSNYYYNQTYNK